MSLPHRIESCAGILAERSLDLLVGVGGAIHNFLMCEPVLVLAGFRTIGPAAALLDRRGKVTLIVSPAWDAARAVRLAGVHEAAYLAYCRLAGDATGAPRRR